jgi:hypothetical protein
MIIVAGHLRVAAGDRGPFPPLSITQAFAEGLFAPFQFGTER